MRKIGRSAKIKEKKEKVKKEQMIEGLKDMCYNLKNHIKLVNQYYPDATTFGKMFFGNLTKLKHFVHNGDAPTELDSIDNEMFNIGKLLTERQFDNPTNEKSFYETQQEIKYHGVDGGFKSELDKYSSRQLVKAIEVMMQKFNKSQVEKVMHAVIEKGEEHEIIFNFFNKKGITPQLRTEVYESFKDLLLDEYNVDHNSIIFCSQSLLFQLRSMIGQSAGNLIIENLEFGGKKVERLFIKLSDTLKVELVQFRLDKKAMILVQKDKLSIDIHKEAYMNFIGDVLDNSDVEFTSLEEIQGLKIRTREIDFTVNGSCVIIGYEMNYSKENIKNSITVVK